MQQKKTTKTMMDEMQGSFQKMLGASPLAAPFGMQAIMDMQRKNLQAVTEANRKIMNGWQDLARRQQEMAAQFLQENAQQQNGPLMASPETIKDACEKTLLNSRELGEMLRQCTVESAEIINRRFAAGMEEIKTAAQDAQTGKDAKNSK